jgi:hypothetical protein
MLPDEGAEYTGAAIDEQPDCLARFQDPERPRLGEERGIADLQAVTSP